MFRKYSHFVLWEAFPKQNSVVRLNLNILVYTAEYWQYTLPNTIYTFFIFKVLGGSMAQWPPSVR